MAYCQYFESTDFKFISLLVKLVDGEWLSWSSWSACSSNCGSGTERRTRNCDGPHHGGDHCQGDGEETKSCSYVACGEIFKDAFVDGNFILHHSCSLSPETIDKKTESQDKEHAFHFLAHHSVNCTNKDTVLRVSYTVFLSLSKTTIF